MSNVVGCVKRFRADTPGVDPPNFVDNVALSGKLALGVSALWGMSALWGLTHPTNSSLPQRFDKEQNRHPGQRHDDSAGVEAEHDVAHAEVTILFEQPEAAVGRLGGEG